MSDWNPDLYRRFEDERTRPARELLARVPLLQVQVQHAVDLGCGPGNSTQLVAERFAGAAVTGIDSSASMLASARQRLPGQSFEQADIARWRPAPGSTAPDLLFANAALQWVPDHAALLPRLSGLLAPGGVLAVQMPDNLDQPSHRLMREVAALAPFAAHIGDAGALRERPLALAQYYDLLVPGAAHIDVWHTVYQHPMPSAAAIVEWLRSTGLRPFLDALPEALRPAFLAAYEQGIADAYAPRADGQRLLAFPRLFIVAQARA